MMIAETAHHVLDDVHLLIKYLSTKTQTKQKHTTRNTKTKLNKTKEHQSPQSWLGPAVERPSSRKACSP
ncbi:unnamed protein product [Rhizophagus irregularis]|nr:unnamed protein product [Rhizophagus irregularis]